MRLREASTPASGVPTQEEVGDEAALLRGDRTAALRWLIAARRTALSRKIEGGRQEDGESAYPQPTGRRAVAGGGGLSVEVGMAVESGLASEGGLSSEDAWLVRVEVPSAEGGAEAQLLPRVEEASAAEEAAAALAAAKVEAEAAAEVAAKAAAEAEAAAEAAAAALAAAKTEEERTAEAAAMAADIFSSASPGPVTAASTNVAAASTAVPAAAAVSTAAAAASSSAASTSPLDLLCKWLRSLGLPSDACNLSPDVTGTLCAWSDGLPLVKALEALEGRMLAGIERTPRSAAHAKRNVDKTLEVLRTRKGMPITHLYHPLKIARGDATVIIPLLQDMRASYRGARPKRTPAPPPPGALPMPAGMWCSM